MSTNQYRFLKTNGNVIVFAQPGKLNSTLSTKVNTLIPRGKTIQVTQLELALQNVTEHGLACEDCLTEKITDSVRLVLSGPTDSIDLIRRRVEEISLYVRSDEFASNWSGFPSNPGTIIELALPDVPVGL